MTNLSYFQENRDKILPFRTQPWTNTLFVPLFNPNCHKIKIHHKRSQILMFCSSWTLRNVLLKSLCSSRLSLPLVCSSSRLALFSKYIYFLTSSKVWNLFPYRPSIFILLEFQKYNINLLTYILCSMPICPPFSFSFWSTNNSQFFFPES